jgi:ATP-dependent DNA helicase RecQ
MALSAVLRTGESFGTGHLVDVLTGTLTDKVRTRGHDALPTFGVGRGTSRAEWQAIFRQMMGRDLLRPDPARHGALRMTDAARPILRGEAPVTLRRDTIRATASAPVRTLVSEDDAPLLAALKARRRAFAEAARVPAYVVFTDRTLIEMAETRPRTLDEMARIGGVGAAKLERYGAAFLEVIRGEAPEDLHPARRKLAGQEAGTVFDRLVDAQSQLFRGEDGRDKPLTCSPSLLARVAALGRADAARLRALLGDRRADRFGDAFLAVLRDA